MKPEPALFSSVFANLSYVLSHFLSCCLLSDNLYFAFFHVFACYLRARLPHLSRARVSALAAKPTPLHVLKRYACTPGWPVPV